MVHTLLQANVTELFVIGTRIFGRILEDVGRAGGETTVCEHAHLDLERVDLWEVREATGPEFWPGFRVRVRRGMMGDRWEDGEDGEAGSASQ